MHISQQYDTILQISKCLLHDTITWDLQPAARRLSPNPPNEKLNTSCEGPAFRQETCSSCT